MALNSHAMNEFYRRVQARAQADQLPTQPDPQPAPRPMAQHPAYGGGYNPFGMGLAADLQKTGFKRFDGGGQQVPYQPPQQMPPQPPQQQMPPQAAPAQPNEFEEAWAAAQWMPGSMGGGGGILGGYGGQAMSGLHGMFGLPSLGGMFGGGGMSGIFGGLF